MTNSLDVFLIRIYISGRKLNNFKEIFDCFNLFCFDLISNVSSGMSPGIFTWIAFGNMTPL